MEHLPDTIRANWVIGQSLEGLEPKIAVECNCGEWVHVSCGGASVRCEQCGRLHEAKVIRRTWPAEEGSE